MFTIARKIEIDAGHRVPYHTSKCRHLHGHRWQIVAHVESPELVAPDPKRPDSGMVVDFGVIKQVLMDQIHDRFDHRLILWEEDTLVTNIEFYRTLVEVDIGDSIVTVPVIPTAESLARYWAELVSPILQSEHFHLTQLDVWETPNSLATYHLPEDVGVAAEIIVAPGSHRD